MLKKSKLLKALVVSTVFSSLLNASVLAAPPIEGQSFTGPGVHDDANSSIAPKAIKHDPVKEKQLNDKLKKAGYTDSVLSEMDTDLKEHLIAQGVQKYVGTTKKEFNFDKDGKLKEKSSTTSSASVKNAGNVVKAAGTISTTALTLYIDTASLASSNGKKRFTITERWKWNKTTYFNLTDKLGLSHSSKFSADPATNGGYKCSHSGKNVYNGVNYYLSNCGGRTSELSYGGAGWNVDIRDGYLDYGWASMNVIAKTAYTGGNYTGQFLTKFGHDTSMSGSLGLAIGPISLGISSSSGWDEAAASKFIKY